MALTRWPSLFIAFFLLPSWALADHNPLLPQPQKIQYGPGHVWVRNLEIRQASQSPAAEDLFAASELARLLWDRTGVQVPLGANGGGPAIILERTGAVDPLPAPGEQPGPDSREAYDLKITATGICIRGRSSAGVFYGIQTLVQLVEGEGAGASLPEVEIHDWPSLAYRGTMVDMSHGPLPTEEEIKRQISFLSRWKDNQYYFYSETNIEMQGYPLLSPKARFTAEQVGRIINYARERHVDVIPCVELYGHLHDLFKIERYADLAVLPHGQDFNALDPRVMAMVSDWVDQLAGLFPSPFMHIGFDEPYDLEKSSSRSGVPPGKLYLEQLTRVVKLVQQHGKQAMFWADTINVLQKYPEIIPALPPGIIAIPWHDFLEKDYSPWFAPLAAQHIPEFVSTYIHNCLSIFPEFNLSFTITDGLLAVGRKYGASGVLINLWTDDNQDLNRMALAGMAYGPVVSWQPGPLAHEQFFSDYARIVYPPAVAAEVAPALEDLTDAETHLEKVFGEETMIAMWEDPFSPDELKLSRAHHDEFHQTRLLAEQAQVHLDHAMALKGDPYSLASLGLGAQMLDYAGMKFLYAAEAADSWQQIGARPSRSQVESTLHDLCNGCLDHFPAGDLMDAVTELREDYRVAWLAEYTPYRLGASLGKFDREYLYWYGFSRWLRKLESGFRDGDALLPLQSYDADY